jgi:hypothetical protein
MFRAVTGDETKLQRDETIFGPREDIRKQALGSNQPSQRRAAKAQ